MSDEFRREKTIELYQLHSELFKISLQSKLSSWERDSDDDGLKQKQIAYLREQISLTNGLQLERPAIEQNNENVDSILKEQIRINERLKETAAENETPLELKNDFDQIAAQNKQEQQQVSQINASRIPEFDQPVAAKQQVTPKNLKTVQENAQSPSKSNNPE